LFPTSPEKQPDTNLLITDNREKLHEPEELLRTYRELTQHVKLQVKQIAYLKEQVDKFEGKKAEQIFKAVDATEDLITLKTQIEQEKLRASRLGPKTKKHKCIPPSPEVSQVLADLRTDLKSASEQLHKSKAELNEVTLKLTRVAQKKPQTSSYSENKLIKLQRKIKSAELRLQKHEKVSKSLKEKDIEGLKEILQEEMSLGEVVLLRPSTPITSREAWQTAPSSVRKELNKLNAEEKDLERKVKELERLLTSDRDLAVLAEVEQKFKAEKEKTWQGFEKELFSTQRHINERHDREAERIKKEIAELSGEISMYRLKLRHVDLDVK